MMDDRNGLRFPWRVFFSELIGTALLLLVGLSLVIVMFGTGSPMARLIPSEGLRRLITGFLFGTTGATIALSAVGKESGVHINPVVTMAFWLFRRLDSRIVIRYFGGLAGLLRTFCFCHTLIICYRTTRYFASKPFTTTWHPACSYSDHGPSNADNGGSSATQGGDHSGAAIAHAAAGDLR